MNFQPYKITSHIFPKRYHGSLTSDLSLLYMDHCLEHLFYELKQRNILENTAIVITADHGFSYSYDPIRDRYVNTPHRENYHVPFLIYDESLTPEIRTGFYESKDVAPTLLDLCNLPIPPQMTGLSILSHEDEIMRLLNIWVEAALTCSVGRLFSVYVPTRIL